MAVELAPFRPQHAYQDLVETYQTHSQIKPSSQNKTQYLQSLEKVCHCMENLFKTMGIELTSGIRLDLLYLKGGMSLISQNSTKQEKNCARNYCKAFNNLLHSIETENKNYQELINNLENLKIYHQVFSNIILLHDV